MTSHVSSQASGQVGNRAGPSRYNDDENGIQTHEHKPKKDGSVTAALPNVNLHLLPLLKY